MARCAWTGSIACGLLLLASHASAQRIEVAGHVGTLDDGRRLFGAQAGVVLTKDWSLSMGASSIRGVGPGASLTNVEVVLRFTAVEAGRFRWYGVSGVAVDRARAADVRRSEFGWLAGTGVGLRVARLEPFMEARAFKDGALAGLYWVGIRFPTGR